MFVVVIRTYNNWNLSYVVLLCMSAAVPYFPPPFLHILWSSIVQLSCRGLAHHTRSWPCTSHHNTAVVPPPISDFSEKVTVTYGDSGWYLVYIKAAHRTPHTEH